MPKKSKRQKIIADLRRRTRQTQPLHVTPAPLAVQPSGSTFQFLAAVPKRTGQTIADEKTAELTAIKRDLGKTVLLAALAISIEMIIYIVKR